ncbi:hypothetical protein Y032_0035g3006 [Ancylostoma ceylanicum]|uniref:Uncharacterized protein n=1 Tax=Ancylostoma ceylanicum TaxID=53326 RepID=A0A016UKW0_9BILA|nr:hypothetical protein Y032_0035g3006 [Ancylostoma ceylanicum]
MSGGKRNSRRHIASLERPRKAPTLGRLSKDGQMWALSVAVKDWPNGAGNYFSTTHRNFTKTRVWYDMNTIFVFSISNNPCMRNLREFCQISFLPWPSKKRKNLLVAESGRPKVVGRGHSGIRPRRNSRGSNI